VACSLLVEEAQEALTGLLEQAIGLDAGRYGRQ